MACGGLAAAWAAAAGAAPVDVVDERGRTIRIEHPPARIISLLPSLTETVCVVGACSRLVGTDRYSNWPASVAALPKLGGIEDATVELIVSLHPDLVLSSPSSRANERIDELGIPVLALDAQTLADVHRVLVLVSRIVGGDAAGEAAWMRIQAQIGAAAARLPPAWRGRRVFFEVSEAPHAASASSYLGELMARLGLANAVPGDLGPYPKLNPEYIVRLQPDLILAAVDELEEMPTRPGWETLAALKNGRSCGFAPAAFDVLMRPGPRLGEAAEKIVDCVSQLRAPPPAAVGGTP